MGSTSLTTWKQESLRLLELTRVGYEVALTGLPVTLPATFDSPCGKVKFTRPADTDRLEREISDAFFLRLKGLLEAQLKRLPCNSKPNWKSAGDLLRSLGVKKASLSSDEMEGLDKLCVLRNCIAHNDGRVDAEAAKRLPELTPGSDIWMSRCQMRNWFRLCERVIDVVHADLAGGGDV